MLTVGVDVTQRLRDKVCVNDTREDEDTETLPVELLVGDTLLLMLRLTV